MVAKKIMSFLLLITNRRGIFSYIIFIIIFLTIILFSFKFNNEFKIKSELIKKTTIIIKKQYYYNSNNNNIKYDAGKCDVKQLKLNESCLQKASMSINNDCSECNQIIYYHTIWQIESERDDFQFRVLNLNIMSYLVSQSNCCSKFILWKLRSFPKCKEDFINSKYSIFKKNIEIKLFDLNELCSKSLSFKNHDICTNKNMVLLNTLSSIEISDFVRFFLLEIYPGFYSDGDVIYLRNMNCLSQLNFAYRWSFISNRLNNAVIGLNQPNQIKKLFNHLKAISKNGIDLIRNFNPAQISNSIMSINNGNIYNYNQFQILHSYLFDPAWLCNDLGKKYQYDSRLVCSFNEVIANQFINESQFNIEQFFPGAFTYHLHFRNLKFKKLRKNSYFNLIESYFKDILKLNETIKLRQIYLFIYFISTKSPF